MHRIWLNQKLQLKWRQAKVLIKDFRKLEIYQPFQKSQTSFWALLKTTSWPTYLKNNLPMLSLLLSEFPRHQTKFQPKKTWLILKNSTIINWVATKKSNNNSKLKRRKHFKLKVTIWRKKKWRWIYHTYELLLTDHTLLCSTWMRH